jgi:hypothetical protein
VPKFAKGDLEYFAVPIPTLILSTNIPMKKKVSLRARINDSAKQRLFDNLITSLASGESHYTYKFIDKNCTSMVVEHLGSTVIYKKHRELLIDPSLLF